MAEETERKNILKVEIFGDRSIIFEVPNEMMDKEANFVLRHFSKIISNNCSTDQNVTAQRNAHYILANLNWDYGYSISPRISERRREYLFQGQSEKLSSLFKKYGKLDKDKNQGLELLIQANSGIG